MALLIEPRHTLFSFNMTNEACTTAGRELELNSLVEEKEERGETSASKKQPNEMNIEAVKQLFRYLLI